MLARLAPLEAQIEALRAAQAAAEAALADRLAAEAALADRLRAVEGGGRDAEDEAPAPRRRRSPRS